MILLFLDPSQDDESILYMEQLYETYGSDMLKIARKYAGAYCLE